MAIAPKSHPWIIGAIALALLYALANTTDAAEPAKAGVHTTAPPACCVVPAPAQTSVPDDRGTPLHPLVVDSIPVKTPTDVARENADRTERESMDTWTKGIGIATVLILLVQGVAFFVQASRLRESVDEMKRATKATQAAAEASAAAARAEQATVETMDATARRQLRAYVFIETADLNNVRSGGNPQPVLKFKNYGQTPAYRVRLTIQYSLTRSFEHRPAATQPIPTVYLGTLAPSAIFITSSNPPLAPLSAEEFDGLGLGTMSFFVYGILEYEDAFKRTNRFLKFRFMLGGTFGAKGTALAMCQEGNESDPPD